MIVGIVVLIAVAIGSILAASEYDGSSMFFLSIRNFLGTYFAITAACAFIWVIAWIGMFLRSIFIWLMEAVFQPMIGLFHLIF